MLSGLGSFPGRGSMWDSGGAMRGEILLDRANYNVMTQYVDSGEHLKIIMKLLRDDRKMINYEGFHVFKVSVDGCDCACVY